MDSNVVFLAANTLILLIAIGFFLASRRPAVRETHAQQVPEAVQGAPAKVAEPAPIPSQAPPRPKFSTADVLRLLDGGGSGPSTPKLGSAPPPATASALGPSPFLQQLPLGQRADSWQSQEGLGSAPDPSQPGHTEPVGLAALRDLPEVLRARQMQSKLGALELGALLGRGSFGKVFKAKWRGIIVAVKIIEHGSSQRSKLDGVKESALSASFQHPNVLVTYKILTQSVAQGQKDAMATHDSKDSAYGALGHAPSQPAGKAGGGVSCTLAPVQSEPLPGHWAQGPTCSPLVSRSHKDRLGAYEDTLETWMLMEFCDRGNLAEAISRGRFHAQGDPQRPNMLAIYRTLIDISAGMDFLHSMGVLHGDLKAANVLLRSTSRSDDPRGFTAKVSDFGLSQMLEAGAAHMTTQTIGTVAYMPAELLREGKLSPAVDVYSFGCIMFELHQRERMFANMNAQLILGRVLCGRRQAIPDELSGAYRELLQACWAEDPADRPPFADITAWLRRLYYGLDGGARDSRQSLELTPWDLGERRSLSFARRRDPSATDLPAAASQGRG